MRDYRVTPYEVYGLAFLCVIVGLVIARFVL